VSLARWREVPIGREQDREAFDCGEPALNEWLRRYARQSHVGGGTKTFLAIVPEEPARILGFYSLSPASLVYARTPAILRRGLGRYELPAFRLGRLAVDQSMQGQGLGGQLLLAAGRRCLRVAAKVGGVALLIDAKSERAAAWYRRCGAMSLDDTPLTLVLPLAMIAAALAERNAQPLQVECCGQG
jgi:GNAT superfamily N-acetyltransferase